MHVEKRILKLLPHLAKFMIKRQWKVALAESCTGGKLASTLTSLPGSSQWFDFSLVTYSHAAKMRYLNVSSKLLQEQGAVSEACALAMLAGLENSHSFRLSVTGFAGPDGDDVGLVIIAWQTPDKKSEVKSFHFQGTREQIITQVIYQSLRQMVLSSMDPWVSSCKCFLAVNIEDAKAQNQCLQVGLDMGYQMDVLEPFNHLHITLSYLGQQTSTQLNDIIRKVESFVLRTSFHWHLNKIEFWNRANALVLTGDNHVKFFQDFHDIFALGSNEVYIPHVTIAKDIKPLPLKDTAVNIFLKIKSFSLMLSFDSIFYIEHTRWHLFNEENQND